MNILKSYSFFKPETLRERIHIIGCGAVGATVAENLVRFGISKITLYDFDTVDDHNVANQIYTEEDIGKPKIEALADYLMKINSELKKPGTVKLVPGYFDQRLSGYVVLAVDDIDLRRKIVEANMHNPNIKAMFDYRMRLVDAQHYAADWSKAADKDNFLASMQFTHEEATANTPVSACNMTLSVCPTVRAICALGVANMINFIKDRTLKNIILLNAFDFTIDTY